MRLTVFAGSALAVSMAACSSEPEAPAAPSAAATPAAVTAPTAASAPVGARAMAPLMNAQGTPTGVAILRQGPRGVVIHLEATGMTPGWHGVHLHAAGTCAGPKFETAGAHVHEGTEKGVHGLLNAEATDFGDLPNVYADASGAVNAELFSPFVRLAKTGPGQSLLDADGSALLIHASPDDYTSQPIGGSGDRVACGVIAAG